MVTWGVATPRVRRDEAQEKNVSQRLEEAFNSFKNDLDDLVKNIQVKNRALTVCVVFHYCFIKLQSNELFQNLSAQVQQFGQAVQNQSKQIVEKLQAGS